MTDIYVDGDACPVREEIYRVAARLQLNVLVVSNGSRPIRPPVTSNVRMVLVSDRADADDDWIAERISAVDVCVTSDIPLAAGCLEMGARRFPNRQTLDTSEYRPCACRSGDSQAPAGAGREYPWASPADKEGPVPVSQRARHGRPSCITSCGAQLSQFRQHCRRRPTSRRRLVVGHAQFAVARMPALSASLRQGSGLNLHDRMRRSS